MTFGKRLARLREDKNLTQKELADLTSISRSRLSLYETDKREPDLQTVKQLASFFKVSLDDLLGSTPLIESKEPKRPKDLAKILEQREDLMFNGVPLDDEAKKDILHVIEFELYRRAKDLNKRKKDS